MLDTNEIKEKHPVEEVVSKYVSLQRKGPHHYGKCPFHDDRNESLIVTPNKGIWHCFVCDMGGDGIDFVKKYENVDFREAAEIVTGGRPPQLKDGMATPKPKKETKPEYWQIVPPSELTEMPRHHSFGVPVKGWAYHTAEGELYGYVFRFETEKGKVVLPYTYRTNGTKTRWTWAGFDAPRPLYNLHLLAANPSAGVVAVEGEKVADALQAVLPPEQVVVVTWIGGANGHDLTDWSPLHGRRVTLWPDADSSHKYGPKHPNAGELKPWYEQPGNAAMLAIAERLRGKTLATKWLSPPEGVPCGWDAADQDWSTVDPREFILTRRRDVPVVHKKPEPPRQPEPTRPAPENPPLPEPIQAKPEPLPRQAEPPEPRGRLYENSHFRLLGYEKDENGGLAYYFYSFEARCVVRLKPSSMSKSNLIMLAPLSYWEGHFPGSRRTKVDIDAAQQYLIGMSHKVGVFSERFIRGRGAWEDNGQFVIHTGDLLIVNKEPVPLNGIPSRYVYEVGETMMFGTSTPLSKHEASQLITDLKFLLWEREINSYLLAGWCVIAPFCGVLTWRPHIWVTGPAGSGKSWVLDNVIKKLLGETAVVVQGKTTEPGVRGMLQNDARPVVFDESDVDNRGDQERIQNILALARSSSYKDGGTVSKGTQTGGSRSYTIRSCFAFSSIGVQVKQQSDRSRFTMLGLVSFEGIRSSEEFKAFEMAWNRHVNDDFIKALQSRTIALLPVIMANIKVFSDAASAVIGNRRIGDQVGGLLAGAYSLVSDKVISYDDAVAWIEDKDWTEERGLELTKDEYQLLARILNYMVRVETDGGLVERTVGELIQIACGYAPDEMRVEHTVADKRLRRMGIMVRDGMVMVANAADGIKAIVNDTAWSANYNRVLERLPGAEKIEPRRFASGVSSRSVAIPLTLVRDDVPKITRFAGQDPDDQRTTGPPRDEEYPF